jgi:hypothetical protein
MTLVYQHVAFNWHNFSISIILKCLNVNNKHMIHVKRLTNSKNIFIINDPLFHKGPRSLVTVSTAVITVLHSAKVIHFHCESCRPYARVNYSQNTAKVSRQGNTMKSFEGSSNKLGLLDSLGK